LQKLFKILQFQSLIGTIKTFNEKVRRGGTLTGFQSLIGTIKTLIGYSSLITSGKVSIPYRDDKNWKFSLEYDENFKQFQSLIGTIKTFLDKKV